MFDLTTGLESPGKLGSLVVRATLRQGTSLQATCCTMQGQLQYYSCDVVCLALLHLGLYLEPATWESLKDQARATLVHRAGNRKRPPCDAVVEISSDESGSEQTACTALVAEPASSAGPRALVPAPAKYSDLSRRSAIQLLEQKDAEIKIQKKSCLLDKRGLALLLIISFPILPIAMPNVFCAVLPCVRDHVD